MNHAFASSTSNILSPREVALQWFQRVWNERDESAVDDLMAPEGYGILAAGQRVEGPPQFKAFFHTFATLFPDLEVRMLNVVEEGDKAVAHWEATGTHAGEALGLKATQRFHTFAGMTLFQVKEGKIVAGHDCWNQDGLLAQMASHSPSA